jgi:formylglycine-generating enzyme required for sulfatase activity
MALDPETLNKIVELLTPYVANLDERNTQLALAFGNAPRLVGGINRAGSPKTFIVGLATALDNYGNLESGEPALAALLKSIRNQMGGGEKRTQITELILQLEKPVAEDAGEQVDADKPQPAPAAPDAPTPGDITIGGDVGAGSVIGGGSVSAENIANRDIINVVINVYGAAGDAVDIEAVVAAARQQATDLAELLRPAEPVRLPAALSLPGAPLDFEPQWILVPAGEFTMGSDPNDRQAFDNELPQHTATIAAPFLIARTPVTNAQYKAYVRDTNSRGPRHWRRGGDVDDHPVVWVSWGEARAYCEWMTTSLRGAGRMTGEFEVRLPTELQWEKAARGTDGRIFPWGNQMPDASLLNFDHKEGGLVPVGQYPGGESVYGCLDMAGNVWEWTLSMEQAYPYDPADGRESPHVRGRRILRGGAFDSSARSVRCAIRNWNFPEERDGTIGFRVVLVRV